VNETLAACQDLPERAVEAGVAILREGERSGKLFVLIEGSVEVLKGDVQITTAAEAGATFGEMSVLLSAPHMATVRTLTPSRFYVVENAFEFLNSAPQIGLGIARLLARRLQAMTSYLLDLKAQFEEHGDHMSMVDEVLETLTHHQDHEHAPGSDRDPDPNVY
jgi:CRP-like cAMP-binding protein